MPLMPPPKEKLIENKTVVKYKKDDITKIGTFLGFTGPDDGKVDCFIKPKDEPKEEVPYDDILEILEE